MENIEKLLHSILDAQKDTNKRLDSLDKKIDNIENTLGNVESRLEILETRQNEIFDVVKAIEHSNTVAKAEIDKLVYSNAQIEADIKEIKNDISTVEVVTAHNMASIAKLKAVK